MTCRPPFDVICFDCDSTLSAVEGIDELGGRAGVGTEMAELTLAAMEGRLKLEDVYGRRLELIRPGLDDIRWLAERYIEATVEGAQGLVETLQRRGKSVHIVSGGIRQAILPLASHLGIPGENVHAVDLLFDSTGPYAGFDAASPLTRSGGKAEICRRLMLGGRSLAMVGDGATDAEVAEVGAFVVGFGGVADRAIMRRTAEVFVDGPSLMALIDYLTAS